jgi:hypothetical protein
MSNLKYCLKCKNGRNCINGRFCLIDQKYVELNINKNGTERKMAGNGSKSD